LHNSSLEVISEIAEMCSGIVVAVIVLVNAGRIKHFRPACHVINRKEVRQ